MLNKKMYDHAAKELSLLYDVRASLRRWGLEPDGNDGFLGSYLCALHELGKTFLFRSLDMSDYFVTVKAKNTFPARNVYAMANDKVALSDGNVNWLIMHAPQYELVWKALANQNEKAIKELNALCAYPGGTITYLAPENITKKEPQETSDRELFENIVETIKLHKKIEKEFYDAGISFTYEKSPMGAHILNAEVFLTHCLCQLFNLEPRNFVDDSTWSRPIKFTVYYPVEETPVDVSILDEDMDKLVDILDNDEVAEKVWDAFINYSQDSVNWLNNNTKVRIGAVEEDNDNG